MGILARLFPTRKPPPPVADPPPEPDEEPGPASELVETYLAEVRPGRQYWQTIQPADFATGRRILESDPADQVAAVRAAVAACRRLGRDADSRRPSFYVDVAAIRGLLDRLLRRHLPYGPGDVEALLGALVVLRGDYWRGVPFEAALRAVARRRSEEPLTETSRGYLQTLRASVGRHLTERDRSVRLDLIDALLGVEREAIPPFDPADDWGPLAARALAELDPDLAPTWGRLLAHAATATNSTPSGRWLKAAAERVGEVGEARFRASAAEWLTLLARPSRKATYRSAAYEEVPSAVVAERNATLLRGLAWCCGPHGDERTARALGVAAEAAFTKIPTVGPRSAKVGNACLWALAETPGLDGAVQLLRLRHRVTYAGARAPIERAVEEAARRTGLSRGDLDDLAVPTFGLEDGRLRVPFGACAAELAVAGTAVELRWFGADGAPRKSEPAEVRRDFAAERKELKRTADDLRAMLLAQRDRIERLYLAERAWSVADWRARYLDHPLLAALARRLVWRLDGGEGSALGAWLDGALVGRDDRPLGALPPETRVRLWHPLESDPETVLAWQLWFERHGVTQPFKQAHREVYALTEAERRTATYSNRFAGHLLRQHQFRALCHARGWSYRLQGAWDGHLDARAALPDRDLAVEFWVECSYDGEAELTASGTGLYLATDQVRFTRPEGRDPLPLAEVPPLLLSELLRDVDLFVGVASVGNDPTWQDRGPDGRYAHYWRSYAFGDLSASAETRRALLERLVPRLAIADRCSLADRFLVVRGDLRTYKIHLGSGNIMMEPNNAYLCIVPARSSSDREPANRVFLPFEGDAQLAVILSKAFMLADDRAITDPTITRQLGRG